MASDGTKYARPDTDGDSHAQPTREQARQGQNVKGMIWVLVIGVVVVASIFAAMVSMTGGSDMDAGATGPNVIAAPAPPAAAQ